MKALLAAIDQELHGRRAAVIAIVAAALLFWFAIWPLPWRYLPDVGRFFAACWLTMLIHGGLMFYGAANIASRRETLFAMVCWLTAGMVWKYFARYVPLPFNMSRYMIIYGLAGILAHLIRKSVTRPTPTAWAGNLAGGQPGSSPAPPQGPVSS